MLESSAKVGLKCTRLSRSFIVFCKTPNPSTAEDSSDDTLHQRKELTAATADVPGTIPGARSWGRIVRHPLRRKKHVIIDMCTSSGQIERHVEGKRTKHDLVGKWRYQTARRSQWGDAWPFA